VHRRGAGAEGETLERLAADEAALEGRILEARREAAAVVEAARQEAGRIAAEARAEAERQRARLRADSEAELAEALAAEAEATARAVAELPVRAAPRRERAIAGVLDAVLGRGR
jgi:F0F1-type ATP synthase membrane subunit b/b'